MTPEKLREANFLKDEIFALEKAAAIPLELQNNPEIAINKGTQNPIFIPNSLNKKIFALLKEELEKKKEEFQNL